LVEVQEEEEALLASHPAHPIHSVLAMPILNTEGEVIGIIAAINRTDTTHTTTTSGSSSRSSSSSSSSSSSNSSSRGFTSADEKFMLGMCAQLSEAIGNMKRRPEEYTTFVEKLELLKIHAALPVTVSRL